MVVEAAVLGERDRVPGEEVRRRGDFERAEEEEEDALGVEVCGVGWRMDWAERRRG